MKETIKTAEILCVGTELLLGDIVNTNAAYLARRLAELGICVYHQSVVGDHAGRLTEALTLALSRADLVITSGGLGPTYDDLTRETVAAAFGLPLVLDEDILFGIETYFARTGRVMTDNNRRQAMVPRGATVMPNEHGTAPGLIVEDADTGKTVLLLPGPPRELELMFDRVALPYLRGRTEQVLYSRNIHLFGIGESAAEALLRPMMESAVNPTVAPYCKTGEVRLRVTASAADERAAAALADEMVETICRGEVGRYVYAVRDAKEGEAGMEQVLLAALLEQGKTVATAESCTGGLIAKRLTDLPGSSAAVLGGFVTYTNAVKTALLGVDPALLDRYGAVSEPVAAAMARGARERTGADIALSTTGLAGPGGGTEETPVGTVFVGVSTEAGEQVIRLQLSPNRSRDYIRTLAATHALHAAWVRLGVEKG